MFLTLLTLLTLLEMKSISVHNTLTRFHVFFGPDDALNALNRSFVIDDCAEEG